MLNSCQVGEATVLSLFRQMAIRMEEEGIGTRTRTDSLISLMRSGMTDETIERAFASGVLGSGFRLARAVKSGTLVSRIRSRGNLII